MSLSKLGADDSRDLAAALRYTRAGVRSTQDVLRYLAQRGVPSSTAQRIVMMCRSRGLLDDRACARLWAEQWARRGYAWSAIRLKLAAKGLDEQAIEQAGRRVDAASDDETRARLVVAERLPRRGEGSHREQLARTLASRGFEPDLIAQILNESFGPIPSDAEP